jgi:DNA recombination protein RmuC
MNITGWSLWLGLGAGAVLGAALVGLWLRGTWAHRLSVAAAAAESERLRRETLEAEFRSLQTERTRLGEELAVARRDVEQGEEELAAQREFVETTKRDLETSFQALAVAALDGNTRRFLELAEERFARTRTEAEGELEKRKQAIQTLLDPLKETLTKLETRAGDLEKARVDAYAKIDEHVKALAEQTVRLQEKTTSLDTALRGTQVRGRWGEMALRNIVELAGMTEHCDFTEQHHLEGGGRPDMVVKLPGGRVIAVDAKAPLTAYLQSIEAVSEKERKAARARHVSDLRGHIKTLAAREYDVDLRGSLDLVVLFLPGDPFLSAAFAEDPDLQTDALASRVLLCTPTTLVALLRTVGVYWRERSLAENAEHIAEVARELYERSAVFGQHLEKMGRGLSSAVEAYNSAVGSFERRLLPFGRQLEEMRMKGRASRELESPGIVEDVPRLPAVGSPESLPEPSGVELVRPREP